MKLQSPAGGLLSRLHEPVYRSRLLALAALVNRSLVAGDHVLDVGCGTGRLLRAVLDAAECPAEIEVQGVETRRRGGEPIAVAEYDGVRLPFDDDSFDVVVLADVLHHCEQADTLLRESARVCKRSLIVKDHKPDGWLAWPRICLLDWAANAPHDVAMTYRYPSQAQWRERFANAELSVETEHTSLRLYPPMVEWLFGGRLHYAAVLCPAAARRDKPS